MTELRNEKNENHGSRGEKNSLTDLSIFHTNFYIWLALVADELSTAAASDEGLIRKFHLDRKKVREAIGPLDS